MPNSGLRPQTVASKAPLRCEGRGPRKISKAPLRKGIFFKAGGPGQDIPGRGSQSVSAQHARKALWGMLTLPIIFILFLPFFCFSRSFLFRLMSPP